MIRRDHEVGFTNALQFVEIIESDSLRASSKALIEKGEGEMNNLGSTVLNSTDPNAMHHDSMEEVVRERTSTLPVNSNAREGHGKEVMEEDRMEFDGPGECTSACSFVMVLIHIVAMNIIIWNSRGFETQFLEICY